MKNTKNPFTVLSRSLLVSLMLTGLGDGALSQSNPGEAPNSPTQATPLPTDGRTPAGKSAGMSGMGNSGAAGPVGEVALGGDSGGLDLPPNLGGGSTSDPTDGDGDDGQSGADERHPVPAMRMVILVRVLVGEGASQSVRTLRLELEQAQGHSTLVSAIEVSAWPDPQLVR